MDQVEYFDTYIAGAAEGAAYFRSQKAIEYPDDDRNEMSAQALTKLQESLEELSSQHPLVRECYELEIEQPNRFHDKGHEDFWHDFQGRCREERDQLFGRYGFGGRENYDAVEFLEGLRDVLKVCFDDALKSLNVAPTSGHA